MSRATVAIALLSLNLSAGAVLAQDVPEVPQELQAKKLPSQSLTVLTGWIMG